MAMGGTRCLQPKEGMLLLFPSWLQRYIVPHIQRPGMSPNCEAPHIALISTVAMQDPHLGHADDPKIAQRTDLSIESQRETHDHVPTPGRGAPHLAWPGAP